jgi:hypothetical protein
MGPAFLSGIALAFPKASVTLDRYHLVALLSTAVDDTRKAESKKAARFKKTRWLWLKNPCNLSEKEKLSLKELLDQHAFPLTGRAHCSAPFSVDMQILYVVGWCSSSNWSGVR